MNNLIENIDYAIFSFVNQGLSNPIFDSLLPIIRNKWIWLPLYLFLIVFFIYKYQLKSIYVILGAIITVALADFFSSGIIKPWVQRPRPCNTAIIQESMYLLIDCRNSFSFISSHACNHFSLAIFFSSMIKNRTNSKPLTSLFLFWASAIGVSQIYVGAHFPIDILVGAIFGGFIGWIVVKLCRFILCERMDHKI